MNNINDLDDAKTVFESYLSSVFENLTLGV